MGGPPAGTVSAAPAAPGTSGGIAPAHSFDGMPFQNPFQAQVPVSNQKFDPGQFSGTVNSAQQTLGGLAQALQSQMNGGGPNLADAQEKQATDRNIAQAFAMAQATNPNGGGALRNLANRVASINQQSAGDSAQQRMQQQLAAQQQLQSLGLGQLGTAGSLMTDQQKLALVQAQGNQNAALHAQDTNASVSAQNQGVASGLLNKGIDVAGNVLAAGGAALAHGATQGAQTVDDSPAGPADASGATIGDNTTITPVDSGGSYEYNPPTFAHGGYVPAFASGGSVPNDYTLKSQVQDPTAPNLLGAGMAVPSLASALAARGGEQTGETLAGAVPFVGPAMVALYKALKTTGIGQPSSAALNDSANYETGGKFNPDPISRTVDNGVAAIGSWFKAQGGPVPGAAKKQGDSYANDTVPAMLSPGEIVLPRSVTTSEDAPDKAADFVKAIQKNQDVGGFGGGRASISGGYGPVLARLRDLHSRLEKLEGK
jgi:hypothetical protein